MSRYTVTMRETMLYTTEVEAETPEEAEAKTQEPFLCGWTRTSDEWFVAVIRNEDTGVETYPHN